MPEDVIRLYQHPYVYLNEDEIKKTKYSIAATIAARLEIKPPSGSVGTPLVEVLKGK
jgi:hypothetical protein